jgi:hypothetical protein
VFIRAQNVFFSAEGAYQHQQRGLRQVEVGEQGSHCFEFEARVDEEIGSGVSRIDAA